jgi:cell division protease FtsH
MFQQQQQAEEQGPGRVTGRVTYSRLLEFVDEGSVRRVDLYDMGRTGIATVSVGGRQQQLSCDLPGATAGLLEKLSKKGVQIDVHAPEKPNEFLRVLGDVAFPLLISAACCSSGARAVGGACPGCPACRTKRRSS